MKGRESDGAAKGMGILSMALLTAATEVMVAALTAALAPALGTNESNEPTEHFPVEGERFFG